MTDGAHRRPSGNDGVGFKLLNHGVDRKRNGIGVLVKEVNRMSDWEIA